MVQKLYAMRYDSPVGQLLVVEKEKALAGLWIEGQKYYPVFRPGELQERADTDKPCKRLAGPLFCGEKAIYWGTAVSAFGHRIPYGSLEAAV